MKKSTVVVIIGVFIILTAFLGMSEELMYKKQKHFNTASELLEQMKDKPLVGSKDNGEITQTNDLKECFSERKRLTDLNFHYGKIDIKRIYDLNDKQKKSILNEYEILRNNFSKRHPITIEEPIRLNVDAYHYMYTGQGKLKYNDPQKITIDLVLVDEGEGLVIDYIKEYNTDRFDEEGNADA
ncbi:hypothetical protein [Clostridium chromiireducens]|uniref:Uncharacterized protein n=1 Tax=Clostridium chromiireducens TaxID=225345 RepID=A0A1V4IG17_9CLOT|nr:hypothetical protein [Clostridium chromiireducens]OPJ58477.1 hypothetical protein CLCHR_39090 [Clostridium chromiireducens]